MNNKQKYDADYRKKNYKQFTVSIKKEYGEIIKDRAKDLDKSVNQYIVDLIMADLNKRN